MRQRGHGRGSRSETVKVDSSVGFSHRSGQADGLVSG